jgi:hypothetical protein
MSENDPASTKVPATMDESRSMGSLEMPSARAYTTG